MNKKMVLIIILLTSLILMPPLGIFLLLGWLIYKSTATASNMPSSLASYGLMSFRTNERENNFRGRSYNDYQIENFIANRSMSKVSEIENVGLSYSEEKAFLEIAKSLKAEDNK